MLPATHASKRSVVGPRVGSCGRMLLVLPLGWLLGVAGAAQADPPAAVSPAAATAPAPTARRADGSARPATASPAASPVTASPTASPAASPAASPTVKKRPVLDPQRVAQAALSSASPQPAPAAAPQPAAAPKEPGVTRRVATNQPRLSLAPSAAEIQREIAAERERAAQGEAPGTQRPPSPEAASVGDRLQQRATTTPSQDRRWPTASTNTQGAGGSLGPRTLADRKGALQDASGPQQGVIRNRW